MPTVITFDLSEEQLSDGDKRIVAGCLGIEEGDLGGALNKLGTASFLEYLRMFKEKGLPSKAQEVQQDRLYFLLLHYFDGVVPEESTLASIFQLTLSESRTLLRNMLSRYRTRIQDFIHQSLRNTLQAAEREDDAEEDNPYTLTCHSSATIEELNAILSKQGPGQEPIRKKAGTSSVYKIEPDALKVLKDFLGA